MGTELFVLSYFCMNQKYVVYTLFTNKLYTSEYIINDCMKGI